MAAFARKRAGDIQGAKRICQDGLDRFGDDWLWTAQFHDELYRIAVQEEDWHKAILHLQAQAEEFRLRPQSVKPYNICINNLQFAECYDKLCDSPSVRQHSVKCWKSAKESEDEGLKSLSLKRLAKLTTFAPISSQDRLMVCIQFSISAL